MHPNLRELRKKKGNPEKKEHKFLKLLLFLLLLLIIILIIIWLLRGSKTISGQYPENVKDETLQCASAEIAYKKAGAVDSDNKELKINALFNDEEQLSTIHLTYTLEYSTEKEAASAEAISHADFNRALGKAGFSAGKFNNKFTILENKLVISLYGTSSDLTEYAGDFFMINSQDSMPKTLSEYRQNYEAQGFSCVSSLDK